MSVSEFQLVPDQPVIVSSPFRQLPVGALLHDTAQYLLRLLAVLRVSVMLTARWHVF